MDSNFSRYVRIVPSERLIQRIVEVERRFERELRRDFSDTSVLRNYANWQDIGVKNNPPYYMKHGGGFMAEQSYINMLRLENIRESGSFKRILAAIKKNKLSFERR